MPWPLVLSVEVGAETGIGHLKRCIPIGLQAEALGAKVALHARGDLEVLRGIIGGLDWAQIDDGDVGRGAGVVLADRVHAGALDRPASLLAELAEWRSRGARIALLDNAGEWSLHRRVPSLPVDLVIRPYAGETADVADSRANLVGASFAPLSADYAMLPDRCVSATAKRVLVSCGGTDPYAITELVITALGQIRQRVLTVRVVLGPGFSEDYRDRLKGMAQAADHKFEWLDAPAVLASAMLWCDVAVATSGVTKYELAATGTPAILLSPDAMHVEVHRPFVALGTCADLGLAKDVSPSLLAVEIVALLDDAERRKRMSRAGKLAVDGRGAARIAQKLKELAGAKV